LTLFFLKSPKTFERLKALAVEAIHADFIALVKKSRGKRHQRLTTRLCSMANTGSPNRRMKYGLIDGIGDLRGTLQKRFGKNVVTPLIAPSSGFLARRIPGHVRRYTTRQLGEDGAGSTLEERALWGRYGL
jgi:serine protease SohB